MSYYLSVPTGYKVLYGAGIHHRKYGDIQSRYRPFQPHYGTP